MSRLLGKLLCDSDEHSTSEQTEHHVYEIEAVVLARACGGKRGEEEAVKMKRRGGGGEEEAGSGGGDEQEARNRIESYRNRTAEVNEHALTRMGGEEER